MGPVFYGKAYNPLKHFSALLHSAKLVSGVNNYLIPTLMTEELLEHFRLRINIAPNSFASFLTDSYLLSIGFDSSQYGKRKYTNDSFKMENKDFASFWTVEANEKLLPELIVTPNKLECLWKFLK
jgi:hypothetical protein